LVGKGEIKNVPKKLPPSRAPPMGNKKKKTREGTIKKLFQRMWWGNGRGEVTRSRGTTKVWGLFWWRKRSKMGKRVKGVLGGRLKKEKKENGKDHSGWKKCPGGISKKRGGGKSKGVLGSGCGLKRVRQKIKKQGGEGTGGTVTKTGVSKRRSLGVTRKKFFPGRNGSRKRWGNLGNDATGKGEQISWWSPNSKLPLKFQKGGRKGKNKGRKVKTQKTGEKSLR